jgi:hypothetical protein
MADVDDLYSTPTRGVGPASDSAPTPAVAAPPTQTSDDDIYATPTRGAGPPISPSPRDLGPVPWSDVGAGLAAGYHEGMSDIGGFGSRFAGSPEMQRYYADQALRERTLGQRDVESMTPAGQQGREGSFWSHPLLQGAEAAPSMAGAAAPAIVGGAIAGPPGAIAGGAIGFGAQAAGQTAADVHGAVADADDAALQKANPDYAAKRVYMSEADAKYAIAQESLNKTHAAEISGAIGMLSGAVGPIAEIGGSGVVGKIVGDSLVRKALAGGVFEGTNLGAQAAGQTAFTAKAEQQAGTRGAVTPGEIAESFGEGFKTGAELSLPGVLFHGRTGRNLNAKPNETGAEQGRTTQEQERDDAKPRARTTVTPDEATTGTKSVPSSPITPDIKAATDGKPVTPVSKPQEASVQPPPPVAQPTGAPAQEPQGRPPEAQVAAGPPPPPPAPEPQPAPAPAAPTAAPIDPAALAAQHAELVDPSHPRDAMIYPKGAQVPDITKLSENWRYGKVKLPGDGGTVVYDHSPRGSGWRKDSLKAAAKDGTLQDKIEAQAAKPAAESVVGAQPAAAAAEPAKAEPAAAEAAPAREGQPQAVQEPSVEPTVAQGEGSLGKMMLTQADKKALRDLGHNDEAISHMTPDQGAAIIARGERATPESKPPEPELLAERKDGVRLYRDPDPNGKGYLTVAPGKEPVQRGEDTAKMLFPDHFGGEGYVPQKSEAERIREAADAEAARLKLAKETPPPTAKAEAPKGRVLRSETPEEQRAAAAQAEADRAAAQRVATEQPVKPATRQTKEPEEQKPGKKSEPEKEAMRASNAVADDIVRNNLPQAGDEHAPDPARGSGGKGAREQVKARVQKMVKEANDGGFKFMKMLKDRKDPELAHSAGAVLLHEAKRLADIKVAKTSDYKRFLDRERDLLKGEAAKEGVLKERRAAGKEFAAAAGKGVKEVATEGVGEEATGEAPDVAEEYEKAKERVAEEKVAKAPGEKREETALQRQAREASERARAKLAEKEAEEAKGGRERPTITQKSEEDEEDRPAVRGYKMTAGFKVEKGKLDRGKWSKQEGWNEQRLRAGEEYGEEAFVDKDDGPPGKGEIQLEGAYGKVNVRPSRSTDAETAIKETYKVGRYASGAPQAMGKLRDMVVRIAGDIPVHYISDEEMNRVLGNPPGRVTYGAFHPEGLDGKPTILLNADHMSSDTPLHEAFHGATEIAIQKNPGLSKLMERLRIEVLKNLPDLKTAERNQIGYYLSSRKEFLTGMMTNPRMQELLKGVRISEQLAKDIGISKWRKMTMWEGALAIIRDALGMGERDISAIEAAMSLSEQLMWRDPRGAGDLMAGVGRLAKRQMEAGENRVSRPRWAQQATEDPEKAGRDYGREHKAWTGRINDAVRTTLTDKNPIFKQAAERFASEPQMYEIHRDKFKEGKSDPLRDRIDAMQQRGGRAEELAEPGMRLAHEWTGLADKHGPEAMAKMQDVMRMANEFGVYPHHALGEGMNAHLKSDTLDHIQARAVHPEISAKFNALHKDLQAHFLAQDKHFKDDLNAIRKLNAKNFIEGIDPPAGSTTLDVLDRMLVGKLTDADKDYYKRYGVEGLDADVFQRRKGPYFPAARHGDFVVRAEHEVLTPKGSDRDYHGNLLEPNVRRFNSRAELEDYLGKVNLPARVSLKYYFDNPAGGRIYEVDDGQGGMRNVAHDEAGIGYGKPQPEYWATMQHKRVEFAKSLSEGQEIHRRLSEAGLKNLSGVEHRRGQGVDKSFTSQQTQSLLASIDKRTDWSDQQKTAMKDRIRETAIVTQSGSRLTKNFVRSQKVQGAEYGGEALANHVLSSSRYQAAAEFQPKIDDAFERMRQVMDDHPDDKLTTDRSRVYNELAARSYNVTPENMNPSYSPVVQKLTQMAFIQDMASASHLLTHQLNLHYMGAAVMAPRHGLIPTFRKFHQIMREAGGPWMAAKKGFGYAYAKFRDPEADYTSMFDMMRNSVTDARRRSVVDALAASQHIHKDSGVDLLPFSRERGALNKVSRYIRDVSGAMDSMGRFVTGLSAYDLEYAKNGGDHDAALLHAKQTIEKGLIHYGAGMRAPAFNTKLMRVITQFRLPGMNMLYLLGRNAYLAFRSADQATRHEAWWGLGTMILGGWAISGSSALPTEPLKVLGILGSQLGITPTPSQMSSDLRLWLADHAGPTIANAVVDGPLSLLGSAAPSFAGRVANPELTFGEPDSSRPDALMSWLAQFTFGATGSLGVNAFRGSQALFNGNWPDAIKYLTPKQIADAARAFHMYEGDEDDRKPFAMEPQGALPILEQLFGVRTQDVVRAGAGKHALGEAIKALPKGVKGQELRDRHKEKVRALTREYEDAYGQ